MNISRDQINRLINFVAVGICDVGVTKTKLMNVRAINCVQRCDNMQILLM